MPDATEGEWLVEFTDAGGRPAFERFVNVDKAIPFLHKVLGTGQRPRLYRETPITLTIDVGGEAPVKSPRRRRKKEAKEDAGAAATVANGSAHGPTPPAGDNAGGPPPANPASPVFPWTCEANFDGDPKCPGPMRLDPVTKGYFCAVHVAIPESHRWEFHGAHGDRNRPVRVAHAG